MHLSDKKHHCTPSYLLPLPRSPPPPLQRVPALLALLVLLLLLVAVVLEDEAVVRLALSSPTTPPTAAAALASPTVTSSVSRRRMAGNGFSSTAEKPADAISVCGSFALAVAAMMGKGGGNTRRRARHTSAPSVRRMTLRMRGEGEQGRRGVQR